eukprot:125167-Chlamydomonas_euryale.AAC.2
MAGDIDPQSGSDQRSGRAIGHGGARWTQAPGAANDGVKSAAESWRGAGRPFGRWEGHGVHAEHTHEQDVVPSACRRTPSGRHSRADADAAAVECKSMGGETRGVDEGKQNGTLMRAQTHREPSRLRTPPESCSASSNIYLVPQQQQQQQEEEEKGRHQPTRGVPLVEPGAAKLPLQQPRQPPHGGTLMQPGAAAEPPPQQPRKDGPEYEIGIARMLLSTLNGHVQKLSGMQVCTGCAQMRQGPAHSMQALHFRLPEHILVPGSCPVACTSTAMQDACGSACGSHVWVNYGSESCVDMWVRQAGNCNLGKMQRPLGCMQKTSQRTAPRFVCCAGGGGEQKRAFQ